MSRYMRLIICVGCVPCVCRVCPVCMPCAQVVQREQLLREKEARVEQQQEHCNRLLLTFETLKRDHEEETARLKQEHARLQVRRRCVCLLVVCLFVCSFDEPFAVLRAPRVHVYARLRLLPQND